MKTIANIPTCRKPFNHGDVRSSIDVSTIDQNLYDDLQNLPEVFMSNSEFDIDGFYSDIDQDSQYYILNVGDEVLYFIDNQGYNYARYACRLEGIEIIRPENV